MNKRIISILSMILILSMLLTACGNGTVDEVKKSEESTGSETTGAEVVTSTRDKLNFALIGEPATLDPSQATELIAYCVFHQTYDYLIDNRTDGTMVPGLAESWEYSADGSEITFHLREGVKFHNGDTMTAEDVAFTLNNAIASPITKGVTAVMKSAEVIDDNTVLLKLEHAFGPIEYCIASSQIGIVNKNLYEQDPVAYGRAPMGTGPYKFVEWKSGDQIVLERFDDYYKGPASIKDITFKIMTDSSTAVIALENGEIDIIDTPPKTDRLHLMDHPDIEYYETEIAATVFIAFNHDDELFSNPKLRQAIAHAVDKESMVIGAVEGAGTPLETPFPPSVFGWPEDFKNREYNLEKAKALMVEAGYPNGLNITIKTTESPTYFKPTEVLQDQLKQIGINAELQKMERGAYFDDLLAKRDYGMAVTASTTSYPDADTIYSTYHSKYIVEGRNYFNYDNKELDALLDEGKTSIDQKRRKEIYRDVCEIFKEDVVSIPLYTYMTPIAANKNLKGVMAHPTNRMFVYDYHWEN